MLFVGGIEERKGLETLVHAVQLLTEEIPEVEVHIVGGVRKVLYHQKIQRLVRDLLLENNVRFLSRLSDEELMREYAEASIFILPSKEESQGIVLVEAMATGTPVIATNAGGMPDVVEDGRNGFLVDCGDCRMMAEKLGILLTDEKMRKAFGCAGREMATEYLPEKIAKQHLQLYRKLLAGS
ncbi:GDP-mannose-dependent alpha-(1-6)-phosphatidylinositol monomannoside mannosyltransferase [anaerobic digester metagenome]